MSVDDASDPTLDTTPSGLCSIVRPQVSAYYQLTKPRLMWLLCLVAVAGMTLAAGPDLMLGTTLATVIGGILALGASGTFNNILERNVDQWMDRTADRHSYKDESHSTGPSALALF